GLVGVPGVEGLAVEYVLGDTPASAPRRRVQPARVVPTGDVGRGDELLARHRVEPGPGGGVDTAPDPTQQTRVVDDRWLHQTGTLVERRMAQDRGDDGPHLVLRALVQPLERSLRGVVRRHGDEVAPELL